MRIKELPRKAHMHMEVKPGDRIYHVVSASGGHGDPWEREPEKVLADVKDEKLTDRAAREQYGVVINVPDLSVDWGKNNCVTPAATNASRSGRLVEPT